MLSGVLSFRLVRTFTFAILFQVAAFAGVFPTTGSDVAGLQGIDGVVTNFLSRYQVPGAAFALVRNGKLIYARGYGYADREAGELVQPDSLFRIASLSKALTAAAILKLSEGASLVLTQSAFEVLKYPPPTYAGAAVDTRLNQITIRQLLNHTGGWDRNTAVNPSGSVGFDPTVNWAPQAAIEMGTSSPADAVTVVRWMMGKPLQFDPGTQYQYSNFGYTVLGRIIEVVTGESYEQYVRQWLAPLGIIRMQIAGSRAADRVPGEVIYYDYPDAPLVSSIFPQDGQTVPLPYAFSYATMDSHGGWMASAIDLARFVTAVDGRPTPPDILSASSISNMVSRPTPPWGPTQEPYYGMGWMVRNTPDNWWHTGSLPGTATEVVRAGNGLTWVILLNFRADRENDRFFSDLDGLGWAAIATVTSWPEHDLFRATQPYEVWRTNHFNSVELSSSAASSDAADPDHDGAVNLVEYALGTDPKQPDFPVGLSAAVQRGPDGQYLTVSMRRLLLGCEVRYILESSEDGLSWRTFSPSSIDAVLNPDGTERITFKDDQPIGSRHARQFRLRIARLPTK